LTDCDKGKEDGTENVKGIERRFNLQLNFRRRMVEKEKEVRVLSLDDHDEKVLNTAQLQRRMTQVNSGEELSIGSDFLWRGSSGELQTLLTSETSVIAQMHC
jgi:hypothetical protein